MYASPNTFQQWLQFTLDMEGFGNSPMFQTANEPDTNIVRDMVELNGVDAVADCLLTVSTVTGGTVL